VTFFEPLPPVPDVDARCRRGTRHGVASVTIWEYEREET
jgi:hypothetical protein